MRAGYPVEQQQIALAMLMADAIDPIHDCAGICAEHLALGQEEYAHVMQKALRDYAPAISRLCDRMAALEETKADAERVLARLQQEEARAQALVRMRFSHMEVTCLPLLPVEGINAGARMVFLYCLLKAIMQEPAWYTYGSLCLCHNASASLDE